MGKSLISNNQTPNKKAMGVGMYSLGEKNERERDVPMRQANMKTPTRAVGASPSEKMPKPSSPSGKCWADMQKKRHVKG